MSLADPIRFPRHPGLRIRRTCDGMCSIPWDLLRDKSVGYGAKLVALALDHSLIAGTAEVRTSNAEIGKACGMNERMVKGHIADLEAAGWVKRVDLGPAGKGPGRARRSVVLLWLLPDDWEGLEVCHRQFTRAPRTRANLLLEHEEGGCL